MRKLSIALIALTALVVAPTTASAHAGLVSANPAANVEIRFMPEKIELTFTEDLLTIGDKQVNTISMTDPMGAEVTLSDIKVDGTAISAIIPVGQHEVGNYVIAYSIVAQDGHKLSDSYQFSLHSFGSTLKTISPKPEVVKESHGAIPLPIALAIAVVIGIGGYVVLAKRRRQQ